jgi:acetolactate synthase-1/2/3 large subunit
VVHTDVGKVISSLNNRLLPIQSAFSKISVERCASAWLKHIAFLKTDFPLETQGENNIFKPYGALLETAKKIDKEAVIATDVGQHQMWAAQVFPLYKPRQWLTSGGLGTMGFGLPAAIGASLV